MTRNTKKNWVIRSHVTEEQNFYLAGSPIGLADEVEYLGVTVDRTDIT